MLELCLNFCLNFFQKYIKNLLPKSIKNDYNMVISNIKFKRRNIGKNGRTRFKRVI